MIYFSPISNLLSWLFCIAAGKRYCLLQIQLQRNLFTKNEIKSIFFLSSRVFSSTPAYFGQCFFTVTHLLCKCFCDLYIVVTLEPPLMHFFESRVVSMSTESGNSSKLDILFGYNSPRVTRHHNAFNQHSLGTTNTDYNLRALRQNSLFRLWSLDKGCCF